MSEPVRDETADSTGASVPGGPAERGVIVVFSGGSSVFVPIAIGRDGLTLGRGGGPGALLPDDRLSRSHADIGFTPGEGWTIRDRDSRNGTFVDGVAVRGVVRAAAPRAIRVAETLLIPCDDLAAASAPVRDGPLVLGVGVRRALEEIGRAAATSPTALVRGETGTGKELAARTFHRRGPSANGPFVAVNCAAIPEGLAERLLFGTKRGAYSGATTDAAGYLQAAHRGVLFLDEGGELDLAIQAKLLRVLETQEVIPLGAARGDLVDVRVCVATHRDLRAAVAAGKFRADLYHRIAPPEVVLPPLRARPDEIAWHVAAEVTAADATLAPHATLIEECLLRPWPGNVRELRKEARHAGARAQAEGALRVRPKHLSEGAGRPFAPAPAPAEQETGRPYVRWSQEMTRERLERTLTDSGGSVTDAARALGMQRTQMYREMARRGVRRPTHD